MMTAQVLSVCSNVMIGYQKPLEIDRSLKNFPLSQTAKKRWEVSIILSAQNANPFCYDQPCC